MSDAYHNTRDREHIDTEREKIIGMIYDMIDMSSLRYKVLAYESELPLLKTAHHYMTPNYNGANCFLIFTKCNKRYCSYIIERKSLSYTFQHVDMSKVRMFRSHIRMGRDIYNGTLLDGIRIPVRPNGERVFIVGDVYYLCGRPMTDQRYDLRLKELSAYMNNNYIYDHTQSNIRLEVSPVWDMNEIQSVINNKLDTIAHNDCMRGIIFYPERIGQKLLFNDSMFNTETIDRNPQKRQPKPQKKPLNKPIKEKEDKRENKENAIAFELRRIDTDIYKLFLREKSTVDGKKVIKKVKIGMASIPDINCSHFCEKLTDKTGSAIVECKYDEDRSAWIPVRESKKEKPSYKTELGS